MTMMTRMEKGLGSRTHYCLIGLQPSLAGGRVHIHQTTTSIVPGSDLSIKSDATISTWGMGPSNEQDVLYGGSLRFRPPKPYPRSLTTVIMQYRAVRSGVEVEGPSAVEHAQSLPATLLHFCLPTTFPSPQSPSSIPADGVQPGMLGA